MDLDVMGGIDGFQHADQPIDDVRRQLGVQPKGSDALDAGSLSVLDPNAAFGKSNWLAAATTAPLLEGRR
jgi:hypothetical protein